MSRKLLMNNVISGEVTPTPTFSRYNEFVFDINTSNITISLDTDRRGDTTAWDGNTDWGDGTVNTQSSHQYSRAGTYIVKTKYGLASPSSYSNNANIKTYLKQVKALNSDMTTMKNMFRNCSSLTSIDFSNFDASKVVYMDNMLYGCSSLTSLDFSNLDTSNVTSMSFMLYTCSSLTSLNLSNINTSKVTRMDGMFRNCSSLTTLDLSDFNTSNVTNMSTMFFSCDSLTSLNLSNFNVSKVTRMDSMFEDCSVLTSLNLSNWQMLSNCNHTDWLRNCRRLTLSNVTTTNANSTLISAVSSGLS